MTEVDFSYTVRDADCAGDRPFIVETTARVRQPREITWREWEPYGVHWSRGTLDDADAEACKVVEASGVILAFITIVDGHVEMVYSKAAFRGLGFGRVLLDATGFDDNVKCRSPTDSMRMWAQRIGLKLEVVK
jgi:GNAT superfamily N-acetyltransferase